MFESSFVTVCSMHKMICYKIQMIM